MESLESCLQINEIAQDNCNKNILLLADQGKLLKLARIRLHDSGYINCQGKVMLQEVNPGMYKYKYKLERIYQQ